jgi:hypothetical protein
MGFGRVVRVAGAAGVAVAMSGLLGGHRHRRPRQVHDPHDGGEKMKVTRMLAVMTVGVPLAIVGGARPAAGRRL